MALRRLEFPGCSIEAAGDWHLVTNKLVAPMCV